jgi:hypothetical protein
MTAFAWRFVGGKDSKEAVVRALREEAAKRGALKRKYERVDSNSPFSEGMTHQDIIDMIERAPEK